MLFDGGVRHTDLLLPLNSHGKFGWNVRGVSARSVGAVHGHTRHIFHVAGVLMSRGNSNALLHYRYEVHRADRAFSFGVLRFDGWVHGARVVIHVRWLPTG